MIETWQSVGGILGGMAVISAAYLTITKLVIKSSMLELDKQHREWCNGRFVVRELMDEKFDGLSKWTATMQGEMAHMRNNLDLLLQLRQAETKE